jgi:AcrR family transcriptional regulator
MGVPKDSEKTCARIIAAAGELFAQHGYHGVTVRDIVARAKTHQSALNYHFSGKESLYRAVLQRACESPEFAKLDLEALQQMPPREALQRAIEAWIHDYTIGGSSGWEARLIDRECLEPSAVFQEIVAVKILPQMMFMVGLLARVVGGSAESPVVQAAVLGLVGQVNVLTLYRQLLGVVAGGLYDEIHRGGWLSHALTEATIAFVRAIPEEAKP